MAFTRSRVRLPLPPRIFSSRLNTGEGVSGQVDPEVADLLGINASESGTDPDFNTLFEDEAPSERLESVDLSKDKFTPIVKVEEDPKPFFKNKEYYKQLLGDLGESSRKVHALLTQFLGAKDGQDRSMFRGRIIPAYWDMASNIVARISRDMAIEKRLLLRFGILSPSFLSAEQRDMLSRVILQNSTGEPIYYVDEWLEKISTGAVSISATDEVKVVKKDANQRQVEIIEKRKGQREAELGLLKNKMAQLVALESKVSDDIKLVISHSERPGYGGLKDAYTPGQRKVLGGIPEEVRRLSNMDREINKSFSALDRLSQEIDELSGKVEGSDAAEIDSTAIISEFNTVRQMNKMSVGRQGNHFTILMKQYLRSSLRSVCTRENVINELAAVESLDPGIFLRTFRQQTNRIVPHIILLPCYGDHGICWEAFERRNRATSRGRIAIPLYPKDVKEAVISALADLRWQVAKEKAQHYWMEEGITGRYYQWFQEKKLRGDVKDSFARDYILWITKESVGTHKLDREVRGLFWRLMSFPQAIKDNLKNRGFVYNELYKKDTNIARSDGY